MYSWNSGRVSHKYQVRHVILLMPLFRRHSTRGPWNRGAVHAKLDGLGHHAANSFKPWTKESRLIAASPVRIAPCTTTPYCSSASSSTRTFAELLELPLQLKVHLQASRARAWLVPGIVSSEPAAAPPPERISPSFLSFELGLFQNPSSESACLSLPEILQSSLSLQLGSLQPSLLRGCSRVGI